MVRYWCALAYVLVVCSLFTGPALAQANIGAVRNVVVYAYGTPEGESRGALFARTRVFARERIETVRSGGLQIEFIDGTELRLGSESDIVLDQFVFNTDTETGEMVANIGKGAFRFITGKLSGPGFKVITPTAIIGVRGTDFVVLVAEDGSTQVGVLEGEVEMAALDGASDAVVIPAGNSAEIGGGGGTTTITGTVIQVADQALGFTGPIGIEHAGAQDPVAVTGTFSEFGERDGTFVGTYDPVTGAFHGVFTDDDGGTYTLTVDPATGILTEVEDGVVTTYASMAAYQATFGMTLDTDLGVSDEVDLSTLEVNPETGALEAVFVDTEGPGYSLSIDPETGVVTETDSVTGETTTFENTAEWLTETGHSDLLDDDGDGFDVDVDHDVDVDAGGGFDGVD